MARRFTSVVIIAGRNFSIRRQPRFPPAASRVIVGQALDLHGFRAAIQRIPLLDRSYGRIVSEHGFAVARGALEPALRCGPARHA